MKPLTAATKLGIYLPAAPAEFRNAAITRAELDELRGSPPEWLLELRRAGPFPRDIVAAKLGVSNTGLARAAAADSMTAAEIDRLLADPPEWLVRERESYAAVVKENRRIKAQQAERRAATNRPSKTARS